jgi:hypothetical protein
MAAGIRTDPPLKKSSIHMLYASSGFSEGIPLLSMFMLENRRSFDSSRQFRTVNGRRRYNLLLRTGHE